MKVILCDDELGQREQLKQYIHEYGKNNHVEMEIMDYDNTENLWWDLESGLFADLLLLDIQMPKQSGIELAHKMREEKMFHQIAFISGVKEYVFEGYDVNAISYLLKPYEKEQLFKILDKARKGMQERAAYSIIETGKEVIKLYHDDIIALEAIAHDTLVYLKQSKNTEQGEKLIKLGISDIMNYFPFLIKIHRSYAVNMRNVQQVKKEACITEGNYTFPIARGNYEVCIKAFIEANKGE